MYPTPDWVAGMIVWTAEAYCGNSCASLPWCTLVAWHKHLWVQLRKTGNGSGMLAWRKSSCCPLLVIFVLRILLLSPHQKWHPDRYRSLFTLQLCYQRRLHWGVEDTSSETLVFIAQVAGSQKWTNPRIPKASFSLQSSRIRIKFPDFHPSCNVTLCRHL